MQQTTEIWILSAAVMILGTIIGFAAKLIAQQVLKRLDSIIDELQALGRTTAAQEAIITAIQATQAAHSILIQENTAELNEQSHRILKLEVESGKLN